MARRSHGTMPAAEARGGQQGGAHILTRPSNRIRQSHALCHSRSNRTRQRASRAMRMLRIDAPIFPAGDFTLRIEQAIHELFAFPMPTFGKNGAAIACCNAVTAQCLQFRKVWRDKIGRASWRERECKYV